MTITKKGENKERFLEKMSPRSRAIYEAAIEGGYTHEQALPICDRASKRIKVIAYAGTGKTADLRGRALANKKKNFLYIAFNKSVETEAKRKFPKKNVVCKTIHALAYGAIGKHYQHKLSDKLYIPMIREALRMPPDKQIRLTYERVNMVKRTLENFLSSPDREISQWHLPNNCDPEAMPNMARAILYGTKGLWEDMCDIDDDRVPMLHDGYLKLYANSNPDLSAYEEILLDEAQDSDPNTMRIIFNQDTNITLVGDPHQQIYAFRGAVNAMDEFDADATYRLTQSFRFTPDIARKASAVLNYYKGETEPVIGLANEQGLEEKASKTHHPDGYISRTFAGTFETAIRLLNEKKSAYWIGKIQNYNLGGILDAYHLWGGDKNSIRNAKFRYSYDSWETYKEVGEADGDSEIKRTVKLVEEHGHALPALLDELKKTAAKSPEKADAMVGTAHRWKGQETMRVQLHGDFIDLDDDEVSPQKREAEANLLYVALTRGMKEVIVPPVVAANLEESQDCFEEESDLADLRTAMS